MANTYPRQDQTAGEMVDSLYDQDVPDYNTLINKIYDWSNRDPEVLPPSIVKDAIRYTVDRAYRTLRIPALEFTVTYNNEADLIAASIGTGNVYQSVTALAVPPDLIEFKHIRGTDSNQLTTRVFNEKSDIRSYWDLNQRHYNQSAFWSRQGDQVLLTPAFREIAVGYYGGFTGPETAIEMHYYRRLPALNAKFAQTYMNWVNRAGELYRGTTRADAIPGNLIMRTDPIQTEDQYDALVESGTFWIPNEVPNWFKNENEKIALYGALGEIFAYLQEDDQAAKYIQLANKEITDLNDEDRQRDASGGNVQVQYSARGLL